MDFKQVGFVLIIMVGLLTAMSTAPTSAQFIPCKIVNLSPVLPGVIQSGQTFQVVTKVTVSCDPSVFPIIRVTLLDANSRETLSSATLPPYPPSASLVVSAVNRATAREVIGSWALEIQVDVISGLDGQAVASTSQLFQVDIEPFTAPAAQTNSTTIELSTASSSSTVSTATPMLSQNFTQVEASTQLATNSQNDLLIPAAIVLAGLLTFALLIFAGDRRRK